MKQNIKMLFDCLQDFAAEHCSMPYRAPELFHVDAYSTVDERLDIWVCFLLLKSRTYNIQRVS